MSETTIQQVAHIEFQVSDMGRALFYYKTVFGWNQSKAHVHGVCFLQVPASCPFGISLILSNLKTPRTSPTTVYFAVEGALCSSLLDKVENEGGRVLSGPLSIPGRGQLYRTSDLDGNCVGLIVR